MYIANKADSRLLNGSSSLQPRRSFCFAYSKNGSAVPKQKLRLLSGRTSQTFEMPYLPYTSTLPNMQKKKEKDNGYGHKLEKLKIILYANNSNGQNT